METFTVVKVWYKDLDKLALEVFGKPYQTLTALGWRLKGNDTFDLFEWEPDGPDGRDDDDIAQRVAAWTGEDSSPPVDVVLWMLQVGGHIPREHVLLEIAW